jgi:DNA invertase Pin-like site-specific DNA recombinase
MRRIGYLRVSTEEQRPDRQIDGLKAICDELHVETLSAVSKSRPIYERVIRRLESGDVLVVWDFDRAYRSAADALTEINALNKRGVGFRIANFPLDTSTPEGYLLLTILSGMAEFERRILSRRTKEGIAAARNRGKVIGRPRKLLPCQIADARRRIDSGDMTVTAMAKELNVGRWTLTKALKLSADKYAP